MKKRKSYSRFIFTQISGAIAGIFGALGAALLFYPKILSTFDDIETFPLLHVIVFVVILVCSMVGSIKIWGWLLVKFGILSKEEAKGYPYSKPWEKKKGKLL